MTPAAQARNWYEQNATALRMAFTQVDFKENDWDRVRGSVSIDLHAAAVTATIIVWYKGDISIIALKEGSKEPMVLIDRVLTEDEDVPAILSSNVEKIQHMGRTS